MTTTRWCANCGSALPTWRRTDMDHCNTRCRVEAWRANQDGLVNRALTLLRVPDPSLMSMRGQVAALQAGPDPMGETWSQRLNHVLKREPSIVAALGVPVLWAMARPLPAGSDRWAVAILAAREQSAPTPKYNALTRRALGAPSPTSAHMLGLRIPTRRAVTASAVEHTSTGRCTCGRTDAHGSTESCKSRRS
jgi:hypothetical protein